MTRSNAFAAIGYALLHREKSGKGQFLDVSLIDSYMHCHEVNIEVYELSQKKLFPLVQAIIIMQSVHSVFLKEGQDIFVS